MGKMSSEMRSFIREFTKELDAGNVAIFAGAGLSVPAGYVNWRELLKHITEDLGLKAEVENDLIAVAQYHTNKQLGNRSKLNQLLVDEFSSNATITENHKILARLPIFTYWTTNYDKMIERSLEQAGKIPDVKHTVSQLAVTKPKRDATVYKMHGDVDHANDAILTKDDYEAYHLKKGAFIESLSGDLVSKTFLFLGFSFTDPNLDYVLSRIRSRYNNHQRAHYCFMRKVARSDFAKKADYDYQKLKQDLFINDLKRFNVNALLVDSYNEITEILREIERIHRSKTVFISGSAADYAPWTQSQSEKFIRQISAQLADRELRIVSGFGLGVGASVITGALEHIFFTKGKASSEQLILRPFPQSDDPDVNISQLWDTYRNEMASYSGIAIFMFGNKLVGGDIKLADGVRKEFEICKKHGLFLIPVGATGYVAEQLWSEMIRDLDSYFGKFTKSIEREFQLLGDKNKTSDQLINCVLTVIDKLIRQ